MTHPELHRTIVELRAELIHLGEDHERMVHIQQLIAALEDHLNSSTSEPDKATLRESVSSAIERLEAEHPRVTLLLNQIMTTLSGSGI